MTCLDCHWRHEEQEMNKEAHQEDGTWSASPESPCRHALAGAAGPSQQGLPLGGGGPLPWGPPAAEAKKEMSGSRSNRPLATRAITCRRVV